MKEDKKNKLWLLIINKFFLLSIYIKAYSSKKIQKNT